MGKSCVPVSVATLATRVNPVDHTRMRLAGGMVLYPSQVLKVRAIRATLAHEIAHASPPSPLWSPQFPSIPGLAIGLTASPDHILDPECFRQLPVRHRI